MNSKINSNKTSVDNVWQYAQLRMMVYDNQLAACTDDELRERMKPFRNTKISENSDMVKS